MHEKGIAPAATEAKTMQTASSGSDYSTKLTNVERLAVAQAVYKVVGEAVSAKTPDSLRAQADEEYLRLYEMTGAKSFDVRVHGVKVGTYSVREPKRTEGSVRITVVNREKALMAMNEWAMEYVAGNLADAVQWVFEVSGELLDGCRGVNVGGTVGEPTTALRVDPQKVSDALDGELPQAVTLMLEGGR